MKVLAISGSGRKGGNTVTLIRHVCAALEAEGVESEIVELAGHILPGCRDCRVCIERKDRRCSVKEDGEFVNGLIAKMAEADGLILGSPVYFSDVTPEIKAIMDRTGRVNRANGNLLRRKPGAAVVAVRRAGAMHAFDTLNHFFSIAEMVTVGSSYWNIGIGHQKGDVERDEEGIRTMADLGKNMAWLLKKLAA